MTLSTIELKGKLDSAQRPAVVSHVRPDGDAVGSLLAVSEALRSVGKEATPVLVSGVPRAFTFLEGAASVQTRLPEDPDLLIAVDCSDFERTGLTFERLPRPIDVNIDHHPTNEQFAAYNLVDPRASATTEILYAWLPEMGLPLADSVVASLMTGLVTDTIGFRTSSVTPASLRVAADLLELGAPLQDIYEKALSRMSFVAASYWGAGLSQLERQDDVVWATLSLADRRRVGYPGSDDADLVNVLTTIEDATVVVVFVEQPKQQVKISWRSKPGIDVSHLATQFGGGGHAAAAGAMIDGGLDDVRRRVLEATRKLMQQTDG
ncbi:MAG: bifunctional oligoribonuclease/PAP phosphatase NrnA [Anaerolineales bacterium]